MPFHTNKVSQPKITSSVSVPSKYFFVYTNCLEASVGAIIGKGGENIKRMIRESGSRIQFNDGIALFS